MSNFYDKIASPVLTDLQLTFENIRVEDVYPRELPDLFAGGQLIVVGRFEGEGHGAIRLGGKLQGEQVEFVYEGAFARENERLSLGFTGRDGQLVVHIAIAPR